MVGKTIRSNLIKNWLRWRSAGFLIAAVLLFMTWHLGTLVPGLSNSETEAANSSSSLTTIYNNPVNAPHKLLQLGAQTVAPGSAAGLRTPSLIFGSIFLFSLYYILQKWFGKAFGVTATLMTATTPLVAITARSATPDILIMWPLVVGTLFLILQKATGHKSILLYLFGLSVAISLYVPGAVLIILLSALLGYKTLGKAVSGVSKWNIAGAIFSLFIVVAPLIKQVVENPVFLKTILAIPEQWPSVLGVFKSIVWGVLALVWRSPYHSDWQLGRLPTLDIIQVVLVLFGIYAMYTLAKPKARLLLAVFALGLVVQALNQNLSLALLLLPSLLILMAAGLRYLYFEWKSVFPHNPIPRFIAVIFIGLIAGTHILYGVRYTLEAWPSSRITQAVYSDTITR